MIKSKNVLSLCSQNAALELQYVAVATDDASSTYSAVKVVFKGNHMACQTCSKTKIIKTTQNFFDV